MKFSGELFQPLIPVEGFVFGKLDGGVEPTEEGFAVGVDIVVDIGDVVIAAFGGEDGFKPGFKALAIAG